MSEKLRYEDLKRRIQGLEQAESACKQAEEALKESEDRFHAVFEKSWDAVFIADTSARQRYVNQAASELKDVQNSVSVN